MREHGGIGGGGGGVGLACAPLGPIARASTVPRARAAVVRKQGMLGELALLVTVWCAAKACDY